MPKRPGRLALFGATGSIGTQALQVVERLQSHRVVLLTAGKRWRELAGLARKWRPELVVIADPGVFKELRRALFGSGVKVYAGLEGLERAAAESDYEVCLNGLVGVAGLMPSYHALRRGLTLALANKESMVLAGEILTALVREAGGKIIPVDSEHSAIFQCLRGERREEVRRLILTSSGGPFRQREPAALAEVTPEEALRHPTWRMGRKITVDCATLMNKGLEVIEARFLFGLEPDRICAVIHPVSVVHSLVEFRDGSVKAQLGVPDMRLPIQYALSYPRRVASDWNGADLTAWPALTFEPIDHDRYPCLGLAYRAMEKGGTAPAVLNGADEAAVELFLAGRIRFTDIAVVIGAALDAHRPKPASDLDAVVRSDRWGREFVYRFAENKVA